MSKRVCGCVIADAENTAAVRQGFEMGGYVKTFCAEHEPRSNPMTADTNREALRELIRREVRHITHGCDDLKSGDESLVERLTNALAQRPEPVDAAIADFVRTGMGAIRVEHVPTSAIKRPEPAAVECRTCLDTGVFYWHDGPTKRAATCACRLATRTGSAP